MRHNQEQNAKFQCPAMNADCNNCGQRGHYGKMCKSSKSVSAVSEDKEDIFLGTMEAGKNAWMVDLKFRNTKVN